jgi:AcrR family transcriptional regulator
MPNKPTITLPWIQAGYETFSLEGPQGLKVEALARAVQKNKSSFYHLFADVEVFTESLLQHHLERGIVVAQKAQLCRTMVPDMLHLLLEVKQDILFNRQLRIHRDIPKFRTCFEKANGQVVEAFSSIWAEALNLSANSHLARIILNLTIENFYLRVTAETLTYDWLMAYLYEIQFMVEQIVKNRAE